MVLLLLLLLGLLGEAQATPAAILAPLAPAPPPPDSHTRELGDAGTLVAGFVRQVGLVAGGSHSCGVTVDGEGLCWGDYTEHMGIPDG